jgi:predicted signal transduction protein with EAL and GGDEF domain
MASMFSREERSRSGRDDFVIIGVAVGVLLVMAALGNGYFELARQQMERLGATNSRIIVGLLLLNVALTIYGWRRYRDARHEVVVRTAAEQRAQSLASTDPLTGFLNRRSLVEAVEEQLAFAEKRRARLPC